MRVPGRGRRSRAVALLVALATLGLAACQRPAPRRRACGREHVRAEAQAAATSLPASLPAATQPVPGGAGTATCPDGMVLIPGGVDKVEHLRKSGAFVGFLPDGKRGTTIAPFCLDRVEVTVGTYRACVARGRCTPADTGADCNWADASRADHPINCVDWCQAAAFCRSAGKRLPTALEWLWAARGGERAWTYPWGDEPPDDTRLCWRRYDFERHRGAGTCPAESYPRGANPQGVLGLAGNVREWTATPWRFADDIDERSVRGGAWESDLRYGNVRSESDFRWDPWCREPTIGLRCVADLRR